MMCKVTMATKVLDYSDVGYDKMVANMEENHAAIFAITNHVCRRLFHDVSQSLWLP